MKFLYEIWVWERLALHRSTVESNRKGLWTLWFRYRGGSSHVTAQNVLCYAARLCVLHKNWTTDEGFKLLKVDRVSK